MNWSFMENGGHGLTYAFLQVLESWTLGLSKAFSSILAKPKVLKDTEHMDGQQESGLCHNSCLKTFHGHSDSCSSHKKLVTIGIYCNCGSEQTSACVSVRQECSLVEQLS